MHEKGKAGNCHGLSVDSHALLPLLSAGTVCRRAGDSLHGLCASPVGRFHMERWPVWKAALLICFGSGIGMLVRYFAEYGEAWWNANFTAENAVRHLLWMTVCGIAICQIFRYLAVKESK